MNAYTLLVYELNYEWRLRGYRSRLDVCLKRKTLKRLLDQQKKREEVVFELQNVDYEMESAEI